LSSASLFILIDGSPYRAHGAYGARADGAHGVWAQDIFADVGRGGFFGFVGMLGSLMHHYRILNVQSVPKVDRHQRT